MKINHCFCVLVFILVSCVSGNKEIKVVEKVPQIINNEIIAGRPAFLLAGKDYLFFQDMLSKDSIVQVFDIKNGQKVCSFGHKGEGPNELITPMMVNVIDNKVFVYDINTLRRACFSADGIKEGKDPHIKLNTSPEKGIRTLKLSGDEYLYISPAKETVFKMVNEATSQTAYWGEFPVKNISLSEEGKKRAFDGALYYDPQKGYILYHQHAIPQLFLYKREKGSYKLQAQKTFSAYEYNITNGLMCGIKLKSACRAKDFCFSKDYIVLLDDSYMPVEKRKSFKSSVITRRQVILLDYNLKDFKVIDLGMNVHAIGGNTQSNTLYLIGENPDYCLAKVELD